MTIFTVCGILTVDYEVISKQESTFQQREYFYKTKS
nr:MAG TPA: hypothetical protein [Caudoviricetes sp.]